MDPKSPQLDPKLKEAYDRVMSMSIPKPDTNQTAQTQPQGASPVQEQPPHAAAPPTSQSPVNQQQPQAFNNTLGAHTDPAAAPTQPIQAQAPAPNTPPQAQAEQQYYAPVSTPTPSNPAIQSYHLGEQKQEHTEKKGLPKIAWVIGIAVFFLIYGVFWLKVFKIF